MKKHTALNQKCDFIYHPIFAKLKMAVQFGVCKSHMNRKGFNLNFKAWQQTIWTNGGT